MILYHRTTAANAEQILRDGFALEHSGVWLSNTSINKGAYGDVLLRVDLTESGFVQRMREPHRIDGGAQFREARQSTSSANMSPRSLTSCMEGWTRLWF